MGFALAVVAVCVAFLANHARSLDLGPWASRRAGLPCHARSRRAGLAEGDRVAAWPGGSGPGTAACGARRVRHGGAGASQSRRGPRASSPRRRRPDPSARAGGPARRRREGWRPRELRSRPKIHITLLGVAESDAEAVVYQSRVPRQPGSFPPSRDTKMARRSHARTPRRIPCMGSHPQRGICCCAFNEAPPDKVIRYPPPAKVAAGVRTVLRHAGPILFGVAAVVSAVTGHGH